MIEIDKSGTIIQGHHRFEAKKRMSAPPQDPPPAPAPPTQPVPQPDPKPKPEGDSEGK